MADIAGTEKVLSALGRWSPSDLAFVEGLELRLEQVSSRLEIFALFQSRIGRRSWPSFDEPFHPVRLSFGGVQNLRLEGFGGGLVQVLGFEISSVRDRGWEGIELEVADYEEGKFSFLCASAEVLSIGASRGLSP